MFSTHFCNACILHSVMYRWLRQRNKRFLNYSVSSLCQPISKCRISVNVDRVHTF